MSLARALDQLVGRSLGEFVLRERIGEGGFGAVYRATQPALDREAVIKVLHAKLQTSVAADRFLREAKLASKLDHPYAAHIYAFGAEPDGELWIAMELVRGTPLDQILRIQGSMPLERFVPLLDRICEVVHSAHEQGVVHRDIKPANVMVLSRSGRLLPKLLDFGIAKGLASTTPNGAAIDATMRGDAPVELGPDPKLDSTLPAPAGLTQHGAVMGSPPYMAPEQWIDAGRVEARTVLYALGVLAYECLAGKPPFQGTTLTAYAQAHAQKAPPPLGPGFPPALDKVFAKVLAKASADRYADALAFAAAFRQASGIADEPAKLPALDAERRDAAINSAPQPIAEAVAALEAARNAHQLRDSIVQVGRTLSRYLALLTLACRSRVSGGDEPSGVAELMRALYRRSLSDREWIELAGLVTRPWVDRRDAYPVPELVDAFHGEREIAKDLTALVDLRGLDAPNEDVLLDLLDKTIGTLGTTLDRLAFLREYALVVTAPGGVGERWMGVRRAQRATTPVRAKGLAVGVPALVDEAGTPVLALAPLFQIAAPTPGAPLELFMFDCRDRRGAKLLALPAGFEHHDDALWDWFRVQLSGSMDDSQKSPEEERAPFRGLSAFSADDGAYFFGREKQIDAFVNRLKLQPLLAVVGRSGAGKSSFVYAGVIPALGWRAIPVRPGPSPLAALIARLEHAGLAAADLRAAVERDPGALGALLRADASSRGPVALVVDQLEEMFTLCQDDKERRVFAEAIAAAARAPEDAVRVVFTLRDDFLVRTEQVPALRNRIAQGLQLLTVPAEDDLLRILVEPTKRAGYEFEDRELPVEMVKEVADQPGALALISFTASKLWELRDRHFKQLTRAAYKVLGGVGGALAHHADVTLDAMPPEERALVREAFRNLVTTQNTRAVISGKELRQLLGDNDHATAVIEKLIGARLLVASENESGEEVIEIVHEALLSAWPRLVEWRRDDAEGARFREQLRTAAKQWDDRKRAKGLLWRGDALAEYSRWRARHTGPLTDLEAAFGAASLADAARGRRNRVLLLASIIASLVIVVVGLIIFNARIDGQRKELEANLERQYEDQGRRRVLEGDPLQALAYLAKAAELGAGGRAHDFLVAQAVRASDGELFEMRSDLPLRSPSFSSDGARVITSGLDHTARVWDAHSGRQLLELRHDDAVGQAHLSPDNTTVLTASSDKTAALWDAQTGQRLHVFKHAGRVRCALYSHDGQLAITAGADDVVLVSRIPSGAEQARLHGDGAGFNACELSRDGALLAVGDRAGTVWVWSLPEGRLLHKLASQHHSAVLATRFAPDGARLVSMSQDAAVGWDLATAEPPVHFATEGTLSSAELSGDGRWLVTAARDRKVVYVWDAVTGSRRAEMPCLSQVDFAAFSPNGMYIVTAALDGSVWLWNASSSRVEARWHGHQDVVTEVAFDSTGERAITVSADGRAIVWRVAPQLRTVQLASTTPVRVDAAAFAPDGRTVVTGAFDGTVELWDAATGALRATLHGHTDRISSTVFNPTGDALATAGNDGSVRVWDPTRGEVIRMLAKEGPTISEMAWSPDGTLLAASSEDGTLRCWEVATGRVRFSKKVMQFTLRSVAFDPKGTGLVTSGDENAIYMVDLDGNVTRSIDDAENSMHTHTELDPAGRRLLVVSAKQSAKIVELGAATPPVRLVGHLGFLLSGTWSPDGTLVITAAFDGTARLWDAKTGDQLAIFQHPGAVSTASFSPDGRRVLLAGYDGTVVIHDLPQYHASGDQLAHLLGCRVPYEVRGDRVEPRKRDEQGCAGL